MVAAALAVGVPVGVQHFRAGVVYRPNNPMPTPTTAAPAVSYLTPPSSLFGSSDLFTKPSASWAVSANSAAIVTSFVNGITNNYNDVGFTGQPLVYSTSSAPSVAMTVKSGCNNFVGTAQNSPTGATGSSIPFSDAKVSLNGSSDNPLTVYQPSSGGEWEFWETARTDATDYQACWGGYQDMSTGNGVFESNYGRSATGISELTTMVTEADVSAGVIKHALAVAIPVCSGWEYPADRGDCSGSVSTTEPAEGTWFKFPAGVTCNTTTQCTTPLSTMVFDAIQTYGMVVTDYAGSTVVEAEQQADWSLEGQSGTDPFTANGVSSNGWYFLGPQSGGVTGLPFNELEVVVPPGCTGSSMTWMGATGVPCPS